MDWYAIGSVIRVLGPKLGVGVIILGASLFLFKELRDFLRERAAAYERITAQRENLQAQEHKAHTENLQSIIKRHEESQTQFMAYCNTMSRLLEGIAVRVEQGEIQRASNYGSIMLRFDKVDSKHEQIWRDMLRTRSKGVNGE